jgi:ABC-type polysaccharide/polyol phosphate transport system ATPase subunit
VLDKVGIKFKRAGLGSRRTLRQSLLTLFWRRVKREEFWALKDVSFGMDRGDILGVVGNNGAGKSTLLKVVSGVLPHDTGRLTVRGRVTTLLKANAGFKTDLTGKENIYLSGCFLGLTKRQIDERYRDIVSFAEVEDFIETPVRHYSTGMKARLGFSVAVHVDPEILIIDEILGAGDKNFRKKAVDKMHEFMKKAKAIVIASHDMKFVSEFCNKAVWLENGRIREHGPAVEVVAGYENS